MSWLEVAILFVSGTAAGVINTVVGSGSLVTFPILVALGYPPVLANVTNNIGVLPGSISGAVTYRRELKGHALSLTVLALFSAVGGLAGALLLLRAPAAAFDAVVPFLILLACVLVIVSPWLKRKIEARKSKSDMHKNRIMLATTTALTGVYGGYFGAAQGVILLSSLSILLPGGIQRANAFKNVLAATANFAAAIVFVATTHVAWLAAGVIAAGAILGGQLGGRLARHLPPTVFRIIVLIIGLIATVYFLVF